MYILGISAFYHDSAACLLKNGEIIAAAQEERFTRIKHESRFPHHAIQYCLKEAGISAKQIDNVVFYEKPFIKFASHPLTGLGLGSKIVHGILFLDKHFLARIYRCKPLR